MSARYQESLGYSMVQTQKNQRNLRLGGAAAWRTPTAVKMTLFPFSSSIESKSQWGYGISSTCTSYVTSVILWKIRFGKATCHDKTSFERYSHIVSPRSLSRVKIQTSRWRYLVIALHLCQHFSVHQFLFVKYHFLHAGTSILGSIYKTWFLRFCSRLCFSSSIINMCMDTCW